MRKIALMCVVTVLLVLAGCTTVLPVTATGNTIGSKVGEASGGCRKCRNYDGFYC